MSEDMLSRIKKRSNRASVPTRDTSLADNRPKPELPVNLAGETVVNRELEAQSIQKELDQLPTIAPRRQIRLEEEIERQLLQLCNREKVTVETFLEGAFLASVNKLELQQEILAEAKRRLRNRKRAGKLRRLKTQFENIG